MLIGVCSFCSIKRSIKALAEVGWGEKKGIFRSLQLRARAMVVQTVKSSLTSRNWLGQWFLGGF